MNTSSTAQAFPVDIPTTRIHPDAILALLPPDIRSKVGDVEETGFLLGTDRRDLFCSNATVQYVLGSDTVYVSFD